MIWLTRYIVVCYPLTSKQHITLRRSIAAAIVILILWLLIDLPYLWSYSLITIDCSSNTSSGLVYYSLDVGVLNANPPFYRTFIITSSILGFIFPVCILMFTTVALIRTMRMSEIMQSQHRRSVYLI